MTPNFLFRRPAKGHTFMTTQDPSYLYTVLCGHCDYPIEAGDEVCPRCQRELEDCPVCRQARHKRAPRVEGNSITGKQCPVCETRRVPFGGTPLADLDGSFCTNIYGCKAGGLVLREEEFAVLKANASACPICRHPDLKPLDIKTFIYLISRCAFCHTLFGSVPTWKRGRPEEWNASLDNVRKAHHTSGHWHCTLCGRLNEAQAEGKVGFDEAFLRVVELGRILVLEQDERRAFQKLFSVWFEPSREHDPGSELDVAETMKEIVVGTQNDEISRVLRPRIEKLEELWEAHLPSSKLAYKLSLKDVITHKKKED
jgi:hypothetical protein